MARARPTRDPPARRSECGVHIREFEAGDADAVVALWERCALTRPWNDPRKDIARKLALADGGLLVGVVDGLIVASVMAGYDGHRGWANYVAVDAQYRTSGSGRAMMDAAETWLRERNCPKLNVQVRSDNRGAIEFYKRIGFGVDAAASLGKRLEPDREVPAATNEAGAARIVEDGTWPDDVERLLATVPEWFGIAEANAAAVEAARSLPSVAATLDDEVVAVCLIREHTQAASEIELLVVRRDLHRRGIGRALVERAEAGQRARGVRLMQVKTFGPSGESAEYERTRAFYAALGYLPLEETIVPWGPENPCLISVKAI